MATQPLKALNERHRRFVTYYLEDLNGARAARLAGFSSKSADRQAHDLLKDPLVQQELKRQRDDLAKQVHVTPALVLREYMRVAFANLAHVADWDQAGLHFKPSAELGPDDVAAIAEMTTVKIEFGQADDDDGSGLIKTTTKVKMHAKLKALDAIVKHLDLKLLDVDRETEAARGSKGKASVSGALTPDDLRQIKRDVYGIKPIIEPASDRRRDQEIAAAVTAMITRPGVKRGIAALLDAIGKGYAVGEIMWQTGSTWEPTELKWRDPRFFVFDEVTRSEIRLRHEDDLSFGIPLAPFKFVQHVPSLKTGIPIRSGLARLVAWCHLFKGYAIKDWMAFLDVFGMPLRLGRYDASAKPDDVDILKAAVANLGSDAAGIIPKGMDIEFIQLTNLSGAESLFEQSADWFDAQVSKAVLGQTMTADNGSSLAQAKVHNEVRHDIQTADADELEITLARDLIRPYVDLNYGPQDAYPRISYPVKQPEDTAALSRSVAELVPVGLKVKASELREKLGLSEPQEGDELLEAPAVAPAVPPQTGLNHQHAGNCPGCGVALNNAGTDIEADLDEIETPFLDDWEQQMDPIIEPLRALLSQSNTYDELKAGLAGLAAEFDDVDQRLIEGLALSGFMAQGAGNGERD